MKNVVYKKRHKSSNLEHALHPPTILLLPSPHLTAHEVRPACKIRIKRQLGPCTKNIVLA